MDTLCLLNVFSVQFIESEDTEPMLMEVHIYFLPEFSARNSTVFFGFGFVLF